MHLFYIILETEPDSAAALKPIVKEADAEPDLSVVALRDRKAYANSTIADIYESLASEIEEIIEEKLKDVVNELPVCIVDADFTGQLNPVFRGGSYEEAIRSDDRSRAVGSIIGQLILTFPEVCWCFVEGPPGEAEEQEKKSTALYLRDISKIIRAPRIALFDAYGVANDVRAELCHNKWTTPLRRDKAAAMDDEVEYAMFHAYTAYRFGFRAEALTRMEQCLSLFGKGAPALGDFVVSLEDVFLNFPDRQGSEEHLSILGKGFRSRSEVLPRLSQAAFRVFISTNHNVPQDSTVHEDNQSYIASREGLTMPPGIGGYSTEPYRRGVGKPTSGIFDLWRKAELREKLEWHHRGKQFQGVGFGYEWPPREQVETGQHHSAPGRLLQVSRRLLHRARKLKDEGGESVENAVWGAVLCTNAMELLGNRTPTTSLEALILRHQFEVQAECQFAGMEEHTEVELRIEEICREVQALSRWFGRTDRQRKVASWNAELAVIDPLIEVFREYTQFDEEQVLQNRARVLHRRLWFNKRPALKIFEPGMWYVEKLLASVPVFLIALAGWIAGFGVLYAKLGHCSFSIGLANSLKSFLTWTPPDGLHIWEPKDGWTWSFCVVAIAILSSFTHLGIFVAHVYSHLTRK